MTVLYGSSVADTTLTTACEMAAASGGVETSKVTTGNNTTAQFYLELLSQGGSAQVALASLPATPTGKGWVFQPGAGTFATGNWSAALTLQANENLTGTTTNTIYVRYYKYNGGVYTSIGQCSLASQAMGTTKTTYTIPVSSLASVTFLASDFLYIDLWVYHPGNWAGYGSPPAVTVFLSTSATAGVTSDMQVTTSTFTAGGGTVALTGECDGVATLSGVFSLATSLVAEDDGVSVLTGSLAAALTLSPLTMAATGTITGTPQLATVLADSLTGIGTLAGTLSARLSLAQTTLSGVGTLSGSLGIAGQAALTVSMPERGQLSGILAAQTTLGGTSLVGIGTLVGTTSRQIMLTCTLAENGQLSPQLGAQMALPSTIVVGMGTAACTLFARTSFVAQLAGTGIITTSVSYQAQMALLFAGIARLSGQLSIPILSYLSATCVTRDMQATARTRDMAATCVTRDMQATSKTRS